MIIFPSIIIRSITKLSRYCVNFVTRQCNCIANSSKLNIRHTLLTDSVCVFNLYYHSNCKAVHLA